MLLNYDKVEYLSIANDVIYSSSIIYSTNLKNDFLGMMLGEFATKDKIAPLVSRVSGDYSEKQIESITRFSAMQVSEEQTTRDYEYYSIVGTTKMTVLRLPKQCSKLRLIDSSTNQFDEIDLTTGDHLVNSYLSVEKLVVLMVSSNIPSNISPKIHEHSNAPHSLLSTKILTKESLRKTARLLEVENLFDNIGNIKLGDYLEEVLQDNDQPILLGSVDDLSLIIN